MSLIDDAISETTELVISAKSDTDLLLSMLDITSKEYSTAQEIARKLDRIAKSIVDVEDQLEQTFEAMYDH